MCGGVGGAAVGDVGGDGHVLWGSPEGVIGEGCGVGATGVEV